LFCGVEHRTNLASDDYWFGLYKLTATPAGVTAWYDGNPTTYMNWDPTVGDPNENTECIRYTRGGFRDRPCSRQFYYTCKKPAGNIMLIVI